MRQWDCGGVVVVDDDDGWMDGCKRHVFFRQHRTSSVGLPAINQASQHRLLSSKPVHAVQEERLIG
jgi:hypothetical protein